MSKYYTPGEVVREPNGFWSYEYFAGGVTQAVGYHKGTQEEATAIMKKIVKRMNDQYGIKCPPGGWKSQPLRRASC